MPGLPKALCNTGGHNADDAVVPALPVHHNDTAVQQGGVFLDFLHGLLGDLRLHLPAAVVVLANLLGKGGGLLRDSHR